MCNPLGDDLDRVLSETAPLWEDLREGRLFLTGGTGFFGAWLLESFHWANEKLDLGAEITVLTRDPRRFQASLPHLFGKSRVLEGDVRDFTLPSRTFTHFIHAAAESATSLNADNSDAMVDTVDKGTQRVLGFAKECQARRFLFVSSGAVYALSTGRTTEVDLIAPDPASPNFPYASSKRVAEVQVLGAASEGLDAKIARCFSFAGPYLPLDSHFAFGNFVRDALAGGPIEVRGTGSPVRSYLYAANLASWLWTILFSGKAGRPYNVGSEREISIAGLARMIGESFCPPVGVCIAASREEGHRYVPSTGRARMELGLRETYSLEETIRLTVRHYAGLRQADSYPNGKLWLRSELDTPQLATASPATSSLK